MVEHKETEVHVPQGCHKDAHGKLVCPSDLYTAFKHGQCFRVGYKFVCEDEMPQITHDMCLPVNHTTVCGSELYQLFHGESLQTADGRLLVPEFSTVGKDLSRMCRTHQGVEFCRDDISELYEQPHDCVMLAGEWHCQDEMHDAWKEGCITVGAHEACGADMVEIILQGCIELDHDWVCPTAVGTKHGGYTTLH